jgi:hypothetical protein
MIRRFRRVVVFVLVFATLLIVIQPQNVHASGSGPHAAIRTDTVSCSGQSCENQDPLQTGCASLTVGGAKMANASAILDSSTGLVLARVYNWYSNTCNTNWVQAEVLPNNPHAYSNVKIQIDIYRSNNTPVYCYPVNCKSFDTQDVNPMWSNMAYAPTVEAYAEVVVQDPIDGLYYSGTIGA